MDEQNVNIYDVITAVICRTVGRRSVPDRGDQGPPEIGEFSIYI
ncbi:MAG: hypothetical protein QCI82_08175 [Candidatus Thermoplasmatota archaeon]|nr:hypothetical protein [Candidatus Thermoplasmatota archaeon]